MPTCTMRIDLKMKTATLMLYVLLTTRKLIFKGHRVVYNMRFTYLGQEQGLEYTRQYGTLPLEISSLSCTMLVP